VAWNVGVGGRSFLRVCNVLQGKSLRMCVDRKTAKKVRDSGVTSGKSVSEASAQRDSFVPSQNAGVSIGDGGGFPKLEIFIARVRSNLGAENRGGRIESAIIGACQIMTTVGHH
jgi:hypothetical protein